MGNKEIQEMTSDENASAIFEKIVDIIDDELEALDSDADRFEIVGGVAMRLIMSIFLAETKSYETVFALMADYFEFQATVSNNLMLAMDKKSTTPSENGETIQ